LSVASFAAMVDRWWFFRKHGRGGEELGEALCDLLEGGDRREAEGLLRRHPAIEARVLLASLRWAQGGPEALAAAIESEMTKRRKDLERGMTLLGTLGNNAPFIGLFGTVIGVIVAFADLAEGTSKEAMGKVMGGIAEALVATGVGLFVAIPAVVAYNIFQKRITDIEDNVSSTGKRLSALLAVVGSFESPQPPVAGVANAPHEIEERASVLSRADLRPQVQVTTPPNTDPAEPPTRSTPPDADTATASDELSPVYDDGATAASLAQHVTEE
jgi:biopolymer transport protein ExbB/TolQ